MEFFLANIGDLIVGSVLIAIIVWAVRQLRSEENKCSGCPEAANCFGANRKQNSLTAAQQARLRRCQYRLALRAARENARMETNQGI